MRSLQGALSLIIIILCIGCNSNRDGRYVKKLYGEKIDYGMVMNNPVNRFDPISDDNDNSVKIVAYVDSMLCTTCLLDYLDRASVFLDSLGDARIDYLCIIRPRNNSIGEIQAAFPTIDSLENVHLLLDTEDQYIKRNALDKVPSHLRCFLLDKHDRVMLVGDPIRIYEVRQLYKNTILENR